MLRSRGHTAVLLFVLGLAGSVPAHANTAAQVAREETASQALLTALQTAAEQAQQGDTLGALFAFERLLLDPGFSALPPEARTDAHVQASWTALKVNHADSARRWLEAAKRETPDDPRMRFLLGVLEADSGDAASGARNITRSLQQSEQFVGDVRAGLAAQLLQALEDHPAEQLALLQILFDRQWKPEGIEPAYRWRELAVLQAEVGQHALIPATLARIDTPMELIALRSDKRFDAYIDRSSERFDPVKAARRQVDAARVQSLLATDALQAMAQLADAMLEVGDNEEVLALTDAAASRANDADTPRRFEGSEHVAWLLNIRAIAQRRIGRMDAALTTLELATRFNEMGMDNVSQRLNLGNWYRALQQPDKALAAVDFTTELSPFGENVRQWVRFLAYRQLDDAPQADRARRQLQAMEAVSRENWIEALLEDNQLDLAAERLIARLKSPYARSEALLVLQQRSAPPSLPGDVIRDQRWLALTQRRDVQAALKQVGRSERYPVFGEDSAR